MGQSTLDSGLINSVMDKAHKFGLMVVGMKANGEMTKQMVLENWPMQMVTFMKETGSTIKPKAKVLTRTQTVPSMMETG